MPEFKSSTEATEHMQKIEALLNDPRLINWAKTTDTNFGTGTTEKIATAVEYYTEALSEMYQAGM